MAESGTSESRPQDLRWLWLLGCVSAVTYGAVIAVSSRFSYESLPQQQPIILTISLFGLLFLFYLAAIFVARRCECRRRCFRAIIVGSILFRVTMLFSVPILEIDIYRYIWDGATTSAGVSPFRFPPETVNNANSAAVADPALQTLVEMRDRRPTLAQVLDRIHFAELPTVYPIVSQVVFALSDLTTPDQASVHMHLIVMKAWLILFDVGTLWLVVKLLQIAGRSPCLAIVYGWCPLLIKEIANSGHLDAIAVFFTTLTVFFVVKAMTQAQDGSPVQPRTCLAIVVVFALAVGSKLYPIVLTPILGVLAIRMLGMRRSLCYAVVCCGLIGLLLSPMAYQTTADHDPGAGVKAFLKRWEMNDFLFLLTVENLRPDGGRGVHAIPWFTVVPDQWRDFVAAKAEPFLVARGITVLIFSGIAVLIARNVGRAYRRTEGLRSYEGVPTFVEGVFLTLAWFWLLTPTQNPWYWTWPLPFLMFARNRAWLLVSGIVFAYYLRFWLTDHFSNSAVLGSRYAGPAFFDFVVTWIEFLPWFIILFVHWNRRNDPKGLFDGPA